jgi:hypothetical protein
MLLDLHVSGTATSPRVSWDTKAMQARLAGRASEALTQQTKKLEEDARRLAQQELARQLGAPRDSTAPSVSSKSARDSLERSAKDIFKTLFGKPKQPQPPPPAPAPDTTHH